MSSSKIKPFKIQIPDSDLEDLKRRLERTRWPNELFDAGEDYGLTVDYLKPLFDYWKDGYNWRPVEAELNRLPQFITEIDGEDIYFVHVISKEPDATPIILTHGWPTTFVEYTSIIDRMINPTAHGGKSEDAFHVVIPSLPGFGFSENVKTRGWNRFRTAKAWSELMKRLGYTRYIAVGNDLGSNVSPEVGRIDPEHVLGVHVTQIFSFPSGDPREFEELSPEEKKALEVLQDFSQNLSAYSQVHATKPRNIGYALADSPLGLLAWNCHLLSTGGDLVSKEFIITNVMIYWLTNTAASAARFYYEDAHVPEVPEGPTTVPIALANFAGDFQSFKTFAKRDHKNIVSWNVYDEGGHFPTEMTPDLYVEDLRQFAGMVRQK
jgi:pimeloyl-ACP methyl ester carboxylesterase